LRDVVTEIEEELANLRERNHNAFGVPMT